jgi:nucleoside permease NupC
MGVSLATLGVFAPTRKRALTKIAPRALIAANMVSLMTASIAGINIYFCTISDFYF